MRYPVIPINITSVIHFMFTRPRHRPVPDTFVMLADFNRKSNILCSYYIYLQYFNLYHLHVSGNQRNKISNSLSFLCCIVLCLNCCTMYHLMHFYIIYYISYYLCFYCDFLWQSLPLPLTPAHKLYFTQIL